jgi:hypothetical protein
LLLLPREFPKESVNVDYSDSENEDNIARLTKSVKGKKVVSCPFGKEEPKKFGFRITKADKISDLLFQ